jgi:hypothetical protein
MPDTKLVDLTAGSALNGSELLYAVQAGNDVKITAQEIADLVDTASLQLQIDGKQPLATVLTNTTASFTTTLETKLNGIEAGADVTDATNVNAAGAVMNSDYSPSHSILVQQSGTGSPTVLQVGNNTLVGRLSGGGSAIDDLSASDVRTLLSIGNVDNTSDSNKPISTATQTALNGKLDDSQFNGLNRISVGTTAPSSPSIGDLWVDTN